MTVADGFETVSVSDFEFLGEVTFATGFEFEDTEVGGLSGLAYDAEADSYFAISDDRGDVNDPRFYTLTIDLNDGTLDEGDVAFTSVVTLQADDGMPFELDETDFEGIALTPLGDLAISSERNDLPGQNGEPQIFTFSTDGEELGELLVPDRYIPDAAEDADRTQGVRDNLAFESLTITPNGQSLFSATENALVQDGPESTLETNSLSRIIQYDTATDDPIAEFFYEVSPVPDEPIPADAFSTNGLVELLALDNAGNFLALERAFSVGVGNTVRLFQVDISDALPISGVEALADADGEVLFDLFGAVEKTLILDVEADLGVEPDNLEAISFGPELADGRQSLIIASDNNFNPDQETQFLAVGLDLELGAPDTLVNGVASGDTTADSTVLWARSLALGDITFEFSTDATFATIDGTVTAEVTDPLLPVLVEIEDLEADTEYFYRVIDAAGDSEEGRFVTAAEVGEFSGLNFGVAGDWRGEISPYPAIANVPELNLDFFIEHGDTIYADFDSPALLDAEGNRQEQAITLEDFRIKHAEVYGERLGANFFADLRQSTSILATIDDHEVINDFAGGAPISSDDEGPDGSNRFLEAFPDDDPNALQNDSSLFENGLQSFQEYNPLREEFYGDTGDDRTAFERELYRNNTYGSDAATFVLDNRSFRDEALDDPDPAVLGADIASGTPVPEAFGNFVANEVIPFEIAAFDASRTLLGDEQLNDFLEDLLEAQEAGVTWKFVAVPEPFQTLGPLLGPADRFDGYLAERTLIAEFIVENEIDNVVFISADLHGTIVNNVTYQETPGGPQLPTGIIDIVTGSIGFDAPFGQSVVSGSAAGGFVSPEEFDFYTSLPAIADPVEGQITGQDDFLIDLLNNTALTPFGLDPVGLDDNLPQAEGFVDAELVQGRYVAAHTFGWTQFEVDEETQVLTVTTYGIEPYQEEADLGATFGFPVFDEDNNIRQSPEDILGREPVIVSQFTVTPQGFEPEPLAELAGFAELPAETFAEGPPAGAAVDANGFTGPFIAQPVQGFSGVQFAPGSDAENDDTFLFLSDNGFGSQDNSADYLLRLYEATPNFQTADGGDGTISLETNDEGLVTSFIQLSDPDNLIPFDIVNEGTEDRLLTGADFDIESFVIAENGDIIIGEEFGPFLLRFNSEGELIEAPISTPNITDVEGAAPFVLAPQNPEVLAGTAEANIGGSNGFEGLAFSPDRTTAFPLLEGAVDGDPEDALRIYEFDLETNEFADELVGFYQLEDPEFAIGDFTPINETEYLVIERDQLQGPEAAFKQIFKVDLSEVDEDGFVSKELVVDLLNIDDPNDLNGDGETIFDFPFVTIEDVLVLDENTILVANDNNFPFSIGRDFSGVEIDNNEVIQLTLDEPLDLDPNIPFLVDAPVDAPADLVVGTSGPDSIIPGIDTDAIADIILTGAGDDIVDLALASGDDIGDNIILVGSGSDEVSVTSGDIVSGSSGDDIFLAGDSLGGNRISGGAGNDTFFLGAGNDAFIGGDGDDTFIFDESEDNLISGGSGADIFILSPGEIPAIANVITDFDIAEDTFAGVGFEDVTFEGNDVLIDGNAVATLAGVDAASLTAANFA